MHQIVIIPSNSKSPAALIYKTREKAEMQFQNITEMQKGKIDAKILQAKDEFGIVLTMPVANISYALLIDLQKQQELGVNPNAARTN